MKEGELLAASLTDWVVGCLFVVIMMGALSWALGGFIGFIRYEIRNFREA